MEEPTFGTSGAAAQVDSGGQTDGGGGENPAPAVAGAQGAEKTDGKGEDGKVKDEAGGQAKTDADKAAADKQAEEAAKALLFSDMKDLQLPDSVIVDAEDAKEFSAFLTDRKMSKQDAQILADLNIKSTGKVLQTLFTEAQKQAKTWAEEISNDKELGGARTAETVATAEKFFELAAQVPGVNVNRLKGDLIKTGIANHPDLIRVARYIGAHLGDDNLFISDRSTGAGQLKSDAEVLYGGTKT